MQRVASLTESIFKQCILWPNQPERGNDTTLASLSKPKAMDVNEAFLVEVYTSTGTEKIINASANIEKKRAQTIFATTDVTSYY